jgi:replicative DNA helicase
VSESNGKAVQMPPNSKEAERCVLGSMLRDNDCIGDVIQVLRGEQFYAAAHATIFEAIVAAYDDGKPVDLILLADRLKVDGRIEDVGGYSYLGELWDVAPTAANAIYYAGIVREKHLARRLIAAGHRIAADAQNAAAPADELVDAAEREVFAIADCGRTGDARAVPGLVAEAFDRIDARATHGGGGVMTGFHDLDDMTAGLQDSELILLAARPSVGKTACSLAIVHHAAMVGGHAVFYASLEQGRIELVERLLCMEGQVNSHRLRTGKLEGDDMERLVEAGDRLRNGCRSVFIDDSAGQTVTRIAANARRLKSRYGIKLVVIDYLGLIEAEGHRRGTGREEELSTMTRRLKHLAKELNLPVLTLAQLNREVEHRAEGRPKLSDLRGSGSLEQDADTVFMLHRLDTNDGSPLVNLQVEKQRNGPTGDVTLYFREEFIRFENFAGGAPAG